MAAFPPYTTTLERIWFYAFRTLCGLIFFFLIAPLVVIVPLSFNQVPYFTFTPEMLSLDPAGYSTRWYKDFFTNLNWQGAVKNSVIIAFFATILATVLGTVAALGLSRAHMPFRTTIMGLLISPMIVPLIISAAGMYFFYSKVGLQGSFLGVILAHTALGTPFVVITVTATLVGFDHSLTRAASSLGASPAYTFFKVIVPLILPGVISGRCSRSSPRSTKWWWSSSWRATSSGPFPGRCSPASASRSARPSWRLRPFSSACPC